MSTLTHEPLALAGVLILGLAVAASLIVGAALWIRSMVLRRKYRAPVREANPGVRYFCCHCGVEVPRSVEIPALHEDYCPRSLAHHIDTAAAILLPEAPVKNETEFARDVACWLALGAPEKWTPPPVVPGREAA